jgi:hypothetical protein
MAWMFILLGLCCLAWGGACLLDPSIAVGSRTLPQQQVRRKQIVLCAWCITLAGATWYMAYLATPLDALPSSARTAVFHLGLGCVMLFFALLTAIVCMSVVATAWKRRREGPSESSRL